MVDPNITIFFAHVGTSWHLNVKKSDLLTGHDPTCVSGHPKRFLKYHGLNQVTLTRRDLIRPGSSKV